MLNPPLSMDMEGEVVHVFRTLEKCQLAWMTDDEAKHIAADAVASFVIRHIKFQLCFIPPTLQPYYDRL